MGVNQNTFPYSLAKFNGFLKQQGFFDTDLQRF